jgi:hypothetical protein
MLSPYHIQTMTTVQDEVKKYFQDKIRIKKTYS